MKRPTALQVADGATVALAVAPWVLAAIRLRRARAAAPLPAVAWYRAAQACSATALRIGRLGLAAESRYWEVIGRGR